MEGGSGVLRISAVVVNYNSGSQMRDCIESLLKYLEIEKGDEIVVVDNQSTDDSLAFIESFHSVKIIRSPVNAGYGTGCNIGSKHTNGEILLFVNPDVTLISSVVCVRDSFKQDANCALVAPGVIQRGCLRKLITSFPTILNEVPGGYRIAMAFHKLRSDTTPVYFNGYPNGGVVFVRREAFERIGGFDEGFFLYYEEADLFKRLASSGYKFIYDTRCLAIHPGGGSSGSLGWRKSAIGYNSKLRYFTKHSSKAGLKVHKALTLLGLFPKFALFLINVAIRRVPLDEIYAYLYAIRLYVKGYIPWHL